MAIERRLMGVRCVPSSDEDSVVQRPARAQREEANEPALLRIAAGALRRRVQDSKQGGR